MNGLKVKKEEREKKVHPHTQSEKERERERKTITEKNHESTVEPNSKFVLLKIRAYV